MDSQRPARSEPRGRGAPPWGLVARTAIMLCARLAVGLSGLARRAAHVRFRTPGRLVRSGVVVVAQHLVSHGELV